MGPSRLTRAGAASVPRNDGTSCPDAGLAACAITPITGLSARDDAGLSRRYLDLDTETLMLRPLLVAMLLMPGLFHARLASGADPGPAEVSQALTSAWAGFCLDRFPSDAALDVFAASQGATRMTPLKTIGTPPVHAKTQDGAGDTSAYSIGLTDAAGKPRAAIEIILTHSHGRAADPWRPDAAGGVGVEVRFVRQWLKP